MVKPSFEPTEGIGIFLYIEKDSRNVKILDALNDFLTVVQEEAQSCDYLTVVLSQAHIDKRLQKKMESTGCRGYTVKCCKEDLIKAILDFFGDKC